MTRQNEQFGVGGENLAHRVLKLASGAYPCGDGFGPFPGNTFDAVFALGHESQRPGHMARVLRLGAMTCRPATASVCLGKRTGQQVVGDGEAAQDCEFALAKACGSGAFRFAFHM